MLPASYNKNGIAMSNEHISINNPNDYYKYKIYDRYKDDYKKYNKENILKRSASNFIINNDGYMNYKYNHGKKISVSSSSDNIF